MTWNPSSTENTGTVDFRPQAHHVCELKIKVDTVEADAFIREMRDMITAADQRIEELRRLLDLKAA